MDQVNGEKEYVGTTEIYKVIPPITDLPPTTMGAVLDSNLSIAPMTVRASPRNQVCNTQISR